MPTPLLPCDGCGQLVDSAHISRRLERLAWTTRFRPIHIQALLLAGITPDRNEDFLYSPDSPFQGEAAAILQGIALSTEGKSREAVLTEFQKLGLMLTHVLECPLDPNPSEQETHALLEKQLPATVFRIRRSLKPKRVLLLSSTLQTLAEKLHQANLGCSIFPAPPSVFLSSATLSEADLLAFRAALSLSNASSF